MKINQDQRLYVIDCEEGYSCLGFDYLDRRAARLAKELDRSFDVSMPHGEAKYMAYKALQDLARTLSARTGKKCECELHPALHGYRGVRVEATFADGSKERFNVGKSTGFIPCYLRLNNKRSSGGGAVDRDEQIVSVRAV